ncbi:DNA-directed RNA polymerase subunit beta' [Patescibacteria group bacterium]|nr:DNA-directed RNA polymerase subunit beta' [Patescibacteria group bacterium]
MHNDEQKTLDFNAIRLRVASPEAIRAWSYGEVLKPETINYRTQKPEKDGLFCEKIFGPSKDWECYCGKYKRIRYKGIICDKCGVEVTRSLVRRERMGHIELATPISHIWFLRGVPSKIGLCLDISAQELEKVIYFASFMVTKVDEDLRKQTLEQLDNELKQKKKQIEGNFNNQKSQLKNNPEYSKLSMQDKEKKLNEIEVIKNNALKELSAIADMSRKELKELQVRQIISENVYQDLALKYGHIFEAEIGAEAVRNLLSQMDLKKELEKMRKELKNATPVKHRKIIKRYKILNSLNERGIRPEWMILTVVPVIPPDVRPMVALEGGRFASSDLNDLYRRVINRNNRLKRLLELNAPEVIVRNEKRMLQEAADALIDNSARHGKTVTASTGQQRMLKSLADSLKGKQGRFRQNLLGKRVDYSGRSVIVVGPHLKLYQCGLPKKMALELFKPFVISKLIKQEYAHNVRSANRFIEADHTEVYDILENVTKNAHVMLNRAPTLHRLGIQAFQPVLIEGKAIQLHPFVCSAFNADFDGDQMAVHVPLTEESKKEAREIMLSSKNLLKVGDGSPVSAPSKDFVLGIFYLTYSADELIENDETQKKIKIFANPAEAMMAYELKNIGLREQVKVKLTDEFVAQAISLIKTNPVLTTVGRIIFNQILGPKLRFVNSSVDQPQLKKLITESLEHYGIDETAKLLDDLKDLAIKYVTRSGITWGMDDLPRLPNKAEIISYAEAKVKESQEQYDMGLLTNDERRTKSDRAWFDAIEKITNSCRNVLSKVKDSPVFAMIESGSRGSWNQTNQMMGIKGLVNNPAGEIIELPVRASYKEGLDVLEYFISTHGARKGLTDTALRTAEAGYLTRKLVDVSQSLIIAEDDCKDKEGVDLLKSESEEMGTSLAKRALGRTSLETVKDAKGEIVVKKNALIDYAISRKLETLDLEKLKVRSVLTCKTNRGLCVKCYGWDLGYNRVVAKGTSVGIMAAQSIGEPGTQLTMRTFHTGGVAAGGDITQGLPRVQEIFEARQAKKPALMAPIDGIVIIVKDKEKKQKVIKIKGYETKRQEIYVAKKDIDGLEIKDNDKVKKNDLILQTKNKEEKANFNGKVKINKSNDDEWMVVIESKKLVEKELPTVSDLDIWVTDGDNVEQGQQLTDGALDVQELYNLRGRLATQKYILKEIQHIYSSQGQKLNDKHIEIIAKQMFSRVMIDDPGDSNFSPGEIIELSEFNEINEELIASKHTTAKGSVILLGITKASLSTSSFLSAASFQETARILIDAAVTGKVDQLRGLKENVIIGKLIPAGTGYKG